MRILDILAAPKFAGSRASRWWALGFFVLMAAGAMAGGIAIRDPRSTQLALFIYSFGAGFLTMWLAALLLVARDGRRLRLPGVVHNAACSMCFLVLAIVAVPAVVVAATGGDIATAILFPALAIAACLGYMLLPLVIGGWLGFIPALYIGLRNAFHVPSPFDPRFQHWAWLVLAILVVVDVVRWWQILRDDRDGDGIWSRTMLSQMRGSMCKGGWWSIDQRWAWRRAGNKKTAVDFREVGPAKPAEAIQVALGGWYVPQTLASRTGSLTRVILPTLLVIPVMLFMNIGHEHSLRKAWQIIGVTGGLWVGLFGGAMLALMTIAVLQRRWKHHAGMALLALLPGIEGGHSASYIARAVFTKPAIAFVVLWLCMLVPAVVLHSGPMALLLCTLIMAGMASLAATAVLLAMAGRPLGVPAAAILGIVVLVLINVSAVIGIVTPVTKLGTWATQAQWLVVLVWFALIASAAWRATLAWRTLQHRPQPFLANAP
ncbi:MAG: hypothetical protein JSR56_02515 [Proteobacteria bacterium]|nr:hypothetical protein [Pseudomonadota bacterium]